MHCPTFNNFFICPILFTFRVNLIRINFKLKCFLNVSDQTQQVKKFMVKNFEFSYETRKFFIIPPAMFFILLGFKLDLILLLKNE